MKTQDQKVSELDQLIGMKKLYSEIYRRLLKNVKVVYSAEEITDVLRDSEFAVEQEIKTLDN